MHVYFKAFLTVFVPAALTVFMAKGQLYPYSYGPSLTVCEVSTVSVSEGKLKFVFEGQL